MVEHACELTHSDNVTVLAMEWEAPDVFESTRGVDRQHHGRRVRLNHSGGWPGYRRGRSGRRLPSGAIAEINKPFAVLPLAGLTRTAIERVVHFGFPSLPITHHVWVTA
jgi:hypothetical protein